MSHGEGGLQNGLGGGGGGGGSNPINGVCGGGGSKFKDRQQSLGPILVRLQYIDDWNLPPNGSYI